MQTLGGILEKKLEEIKSRKSTSNAKTRVSETLEKYEKHILWNNETYFKDRKAIYMAAHVYIKRHTWKEFEDILEWVKKIDDHKTPLVPLQVLTVLRK